MSYNAQRLGEVADGVRHGLTAVKCHREQKASGFHSDSHFAKPLVM